MRQSPWKARSVQTSQVPDSTRIDVARWFGFANCAQSKSFACPRSTAASTPPKFGYSYSRIRPVAGAAATTGGDTTTGCAGATTAGGLTTTGTGLTTTGPGLTTTGAVTVATGAVTVGAATTTAGCVTTATRSEGASSRTDVTGALSVR